MLLRNFLRLFGSLLVDILYSNISFSRPCANVELICRGLCLWIFYQTLDNYTPKLQTTTSFIGSNPGLGFRPMRTETDPYSSLVWFRHGGAGNWDYLRQNLDRFLVEYEPGFWANAGASQTKCHWGRGPLSKEEACEFNKEWLSDQVSLLQHASKKHLRVSTVRSQPSGQRHQVHQRGELRLPPRQTMPLAQAEPYLRLDARAFHHFRGGGTPGDAG